jgi:hypothetical protein
MASAYLSRGNRLVVRNTKRRKRLGKATTKNAADYKSAARQRSIAVNVASDSRNMIDGNELDRAIAVQQSARARDSRLDLEMRRC